jgi:arginine/serine-rich splicing factor 16
VFLVDSTSSAVAKLKGAVGGVGKTPQAEKKETPQERLKRIMSKQLNKQSMLCFFILICSNLRNANHVSSYVLYTKLLFVSTVKKDTAAETAKKREQERQRQEKLAEVGRYRRRSRSRSPSRSPPRYLNQSLSRRVLSLWAS